MIAVMVEYREQGGDPDDLMFFVNKLVSEAMKNIPPKRKENDDAEVC
jgi:hypothetical protein